MKLKVYFDEGVKGRYTRTEFMIKTGWSRTKLWNIENGKVDIKLEDALEAVNTTNGVVDLHSFSVKKKQINKT